MTKSILSPPNKTTKPTPAKKPPRRKRVVAVPDMLPREKLTRKAIEAISQYATIKCGDLPVHFAMVRAVLEAERMRRRDLYIWLAERGYRWRPALGAWQKVRGK